MGVVEAGIAPGGRQNVSASVTVEKIVRPHPQPPVIHRHLYAAPPKAEAYAGGTLRLEIEQVAESLGPQKGRQPQNHGRGHSGQTPPPTR